MAVRAARKIVTREERLRRYVEKLRHDPEFRETVKESVEDDSPGLTKEEARRQYLRK